MLASSFRIGLLFLFIHTGIQAQVINQSIVLDWKNELRVIEPIKDFRIEQLQFTDAQYDDQQPSIPIFAQRLELPAYGAIRAELRNAQYAPLTNTGSIELPDASNPIIKAEVALARQQPFGLISFVPIRKNPTTGQYEKLIRADLQVQVAPQPLPSFSGGRNYTTTSQLASGSIYKIAVTQTGVQKLDYTFLKDLGIDIENIDPRTIQILGQPGTALPERMNVPIPDDLLENHIVVAGEDDGSFDQNDYILFYGVSPKTWSYNNTASCSPFRHEINHYTDESYYYIKVGVQTGLRMQERPSVNNSTYTTTSYDHLQFHEIDELNLMEKEFALPPSGREWYGESFLITRNRQFNFTYSDRIENEPVSIISNLAVRCFSPGNATMRVNGTAVGSPVNTPPTSIQIYTAYAIPISFDCVGRTYNGQNLNVELALNHASSAADMWLNYLTVHARSRLNFRSGQLAFRDHRTVGQGIAQYQLTGANGVTIWDVTDPQAVVIQQYNGSGNVNFAADATQLHEFVAFDNSQYHTPKSKGSVANQNLHGMVNPPEAVFVVHSSFRTEADRLAAHRRQHDGMTVEVVNVEDIYNEFSSGSPDVTAIRDFARMLYTRSNSNNNFTHLLLFGIGSFDYKSIGANRANAPNQNLVPLYQTPESLHPINTYTSDDYFALLDTAENMRSFGLLDIAVGRLPVATVAEARAMVDKIIRYETNLNTFRDWKNRLCYVADDEDQNEYFYDSEGASTLTNNKDSGYIINKIYFDAFQQVSTTGGQRYPDVKRAILDALFKGTFVINYIGHGADDGWAQERVFTNADIGNINNANKLPLFITATCSFGPHDDPNISSAAELLLLHPTNGAISMLTTTRVVIASDNELLVRNTLNVLYTPKANGKMPTTGEVLQMAKNNAGLSRPTNSRKYTLLGDPTMKLAYPDYDIRTLSINSRPTTSSILDSIHALDHVTITGDIVDKNGNRINDFNGILYPTVFDKLDRLFTLGNDPASIPSYFDVRQKVIFKGQASVRNGQWSFNFVVPRDINYSYGTGMISYYAQNNNYKDASGHYNKILVGGSSLTSVEDNQGPDVLVYMNTEEFARNGITDASPKILVKLYDENGINTVGNSIGHDLVADVSDPAQQKNSYVLNDFYESKIDDYTTGSALYPLKDLKPGLHTVEVTAWDTYNNPGKGSTEFIVAESADMALAHVLNYPNPFTTNTKFQFEHNLPYQNLRVQVQIYTVSGRLVKTIFHDVAAEKNAGYRIDDIEWDGLDEYGDRLGKGVYIYKVFVQAEGADDAIQQTSEFQKLVLLR